jgi:phosphohistidine phosphatase
MKHLILCRHAKSSWKDQSLHDIERPLNKRGKRDAPVMGERLYGHGIVPDVILSSPARRALKTARQLAKKTGFSRKHITVVDDMYGASPDRLLVLIQGLNNTCTTAALVGHNPETTLLANMLGGLNIYNVPTCGIVVLEFDVGSWEDVGVRQGTQLFFDYPRKSDRQEQS